ncbi:hypothetical protein B2D07_15770 [Desulfococcus multivorans]|uniref:Type I restriction enzyme R protein N-terminal domain-containing protein n=2 Tax=Desulfococcaceae TaxID=2931039 RepID=S7TH37_DESML|nr:hypothetical protein B2D07_15770 [Desulfococcus multivorans]EPR35920.1 hypothetical protein dsmv_0625 [Desulfococcus multivorans DSM 2059]SJZ35157.1 Type I restriction enzyme R protein N terminus (HSDR_N) [Desulfococcus multivorans DSM 2059]
MTGHHLILGELTDAVTGEVLADSHDERYRQKVARILLSEKGYVKAEITPRVPLTAIAGKRRGKIRVAFAVSVDGRIGMIIQYGPGSLVTRHRPALAMSRLLADYQIPVAVVTNGEDVDVLDGFSGNIVGRGFDALPAREALGKIVAGSAFTPISPRRADLESRIVYCYEIDGSCPCDTDICRLDETDED